MLSKHFLTCHRNITINRIVSRWSVEEVEAMVKVKQEEQRQNSLETMMTCMDEISGDLDVDLNDDDNLHNF